MFEMKIVLDTHNEYIKFYSKYAAIYKAKEYGVCADVLALEVISCETGEVIIQFVNGKLIWAEGFGKF